MRAVVYDRPGSFEVTDVPDPVPDPEDALLQVTMAGVCGTDLHLHDGEFGPAYPLIPGHEIVGEILQLGSAAEVAGSVANPSGLRVGQRVALDNTTSCGSCIECRRGRPAYCRFLIARGVNAPGGFAELFCAPAAKCYAVDDLTDDVAVFAEPTACVVHGMDVLNLAPGSDVLLFGAGPTGILMAQMLKRSGTRRLTVAAPTRAKLDVVAGRGADRVVELERDDPGASDAALRAIAPEGFDVVVDATGAPGVLHQTIALTRTGGTVFVYGMTAETATWGVRPYEVFRRELTIRGSFAQQFSFDRSLEALRAGSVDTAGMITDTFDLDHYAQALAAVASSESIKVVIEPNS